MLRLTSFVVGFGDKIVHLGLMLKHHQRDHIAVFREIMVRIQPRRQVGDIRPLLGVDRRLGLFVGNRVASMPQPPCLPVTYQPPNRS